ncbi:MAG: PAS domain-containing protein [Chloroflexota bacterium]|nr:PAS domain-containing protein [Chloroflexota bacterium]
MAILDADGSRRYVSPGIERALGYTPDELIGANVFDLIHQDDLPRTRRLFAELLEQAGGTSQAELRLRHRDGSGAGPRRSRSPGSAPASRATPPGGCGCWRTRGSAGSPPRPLPAPPPRRALLAGCRSLRQSSSSPRPEGRRFLDRRSHSPPGSTPGAPPGRPLPPRSPPAAQGRTRGSSPASRSGAQPHHRPVPDPVPDCGRPRQPTRPTRQCPGRRWDSPPPRPHPGSSHRRRAPGVERGFAPPGKAGRATRRWWPAASAAAPGGHAARRLATRAGGPAATVTPRAAARAPGPRPTRSPGAALQAERRSRPRPGPWRW